MGGLGEIGRGQEKLGAVHDHDFGVETGAGVGVGVQRARIEIDFRKGLPGPMAIAKFVGISENDGVGG